METIKDQKGFTLIELIVVVSLIGIIGAMIIPAAQYGMMTAKSKLMTDVSSVKTIKRTAEAFKADQGEYPDMTDGEAFVKNLFDKGYFESSRINYQTKGAKLNVYMDSNGDLICKLDVLDVGDRDVKKAIQKMNKDIQDMIIFQA